MRKWLMRLSTITIIILLSKSHQGLIDSISNFIIDGAVPFTNWALGEFLSVILIGLGIYFIYKTVSDLRFDMLKRRAILYNQHQNKLQLLNTNAKLASAKTTNQVEDLELAQNSF